MTPAKIVGCPFVFTTEGTNPISGYATCKSKLDNQVVKELRYIAVDCFLEGRPKDEPTWESHVRAICSEQGWDFDDVVRENPA